eukprot:jgi/Undpi1/13537/HiC_scaffold_8.g03196.m1
MSHPTPPSALRFNKERATNMPPHGIHSNGGPLQPLQSPPRQASASATSVPATADWVSGTKSQSELRRHKKKNKERARKQRRGESRRNTAVHTQVVGEVQDKVSAADNRNQTADPATTRRRTDVVVSSNKVVPVAVAVAAAAEHEQQVAAVDAAPDESSADNKNQATHPAATRPTEHVGSSNQLAVAAAKVAVAVVAPSSIETVAEPSSAALVETEGGRINNQPAIARVRLGSLLLPLVKKFRGSRPTIAGNQMSVEVEEKVVVAAAPSPIATVSEPPSSSSSPSAITTVSDITTSREALARARLSSYLLPLINKFRRSKAAGKRLDNSRSLAAKAVEDLGDQQALPEKPAAELAEVLMAEAAELAAVAVKARAEAEALEKQVAERDNIAEKLFVLVIENLDNRAAVLKKKMCGSDTLDAAEITFLEMYTGKALAEQHGCVHGGSHDSVSTCQLESSESTGDSKHSEGTGLGVQQCSPQPAAALCPVPAVQQVHPGQCLVDVRGTFYPVTSPPMQQQQQGDQGWVPEGVCQYEAEHPTPMQYVHPQASGYEVGNGMDMCCSSTLPHMQPHNCTYGEHSEGAYMELPAQQYGGDANYPAQVLPEQPLHTACSGNMMNVDILAAVRAVAAAMALHVAKTPHSDGLFIL